MSHNHHHAAFDYSRAFAIGVSLNVGLVLLEVAYGILSGSLALLADAGHNLGDVLGLLLAWGAFLLARRKPTSRRTYGYRKTTILAALLSAVLLLMALGVIAWEALNRFSDPAPVSGTTIMAVAGISVVINLATAMLFRSGRRRDLNIRGAYLHMAADAAVSLGVVIAGLAIMATDWLWLDPAISLLIVAVVLVGTWDLLRDSIELSIDAVPKNIDPAQVDDYLRNLPGVTAVHDLHIWGMSTLDVALTAHLVIPENSSGDRFLTTLAHELHERFGIEHTTIQIERGDSEYPCGLDSPDRI